MEYRTKAAVKIIAGHAGRKRVKRGCIYGKE